MILSFQLQLSTGTFWSYFEQLTWRIDTVLDGLQSRLLTSGPEELTIEDTQDNFMDHLEVIKGRFSKKIEKEKALFAKVIEVAFQNANLTKEQTQDRRR